MKNQLTLLTFLFFVVFNTTAQEATKTHKFKTSTYQTIDQDKLDLRISYFGVRVFQPGMSLATEYVTKKKTNHFNTGRFWNFIGISYEGYPKKNHRHESVAVDVAYYHHRSNHNGLLLYPSIHRRYITDKGWYNDIGLGLGQLKTFYPTTTYEANEDGSFSEKRLAGRRYTAMVFSYEYGIDLSFRRSSNLKLFYHTDFFLLFRYNNGFNANIAHRLGIAFPLIPNPIKHKSAKL